MSKTGGHVHDTVGGELRKARLVGGKAKGWVIATGQKAPSSQNL